MEDKINLHGHLSISSADEMRKICKPLFDTFPITCFRYLKIFPDNSRIVLCTNPETTQYIYEEGNYKFMWYDGNSGITQQTGWQAWQINRAVDKRDIHKKIDGELEKFFNLSHGLTYVQRNRTSLEVYSFDTDSPLIYLNIDLSMLMRFIYYFKSNPGAKKLLISAENEKIIIPKHTSPHIPEKLFGHDEKIAKYLLQTQIKKYYLGGELEGTYLTNTEVKCIHWLLLGKSAEEIALLSNSKKKTIEKHIENIKQKLGCHKQSALIKKISGLLLIPNDQKNSSFLDF